MLGIDTGGTYTDAVLFEKEQGVIQSAKSLTTKHDLSIGITDSCRQVLGDIDAKDIKLVSLSSTLATNAIVEKQGSPVCLILVGHSPSALEKGNLKDALDCDPYYFVDGGHKASGEENTPLNEEKIIEIGKKYKNKVSAFAVCGIFSTRNKDHEHRIKNLLREHSDLPVSLSSDLADSLDAPKRALTALLNARLLTQIHHLIYAVQSFLDAHKISAPLMIVQGNGSLMHAQVALDKPVETIMSGPAASVIGASYLTGTKNAFISDIGGTTTDIAIIKNGEPILSPKGATINGWNTMVEAIAVYTVGLGGDSQVHDKKGDLQLGPRRVTPLALLAQQYPHITEQLQQQLDHKIGREYDGIFAHRLRVLDTAEDSLSNTELHFWNALKSAPQSLNTLLDNGKMPKPLYSLIDRGLVILSAFTTSDASHILNLQDTWCRDASVLGGKLWCRKDRYQDTPWARDEEEFSKLVIEQMTLQTSQALIASAYKAEKNVDLLHEDEQVKKLLDNIIEGEKNASFCLNIKFEKPIIGLGASASLYYPAVADKLNADLTIPTYAQTANAVGAIVGKITKTCTVTITAPDDETFRVHGGKYKDFKNLEKAVEYAIQYGTRLSVDYVEKNLGTSIQTQVTRRDNIIDSNNANIFMQSIVTIKSMGQPKI